MCLGLCFPKSQPWVKDLGSGSLLERWLQALVSCLSSGGRKQEGEEANTGLICHCTGKIGLSLLRNDVNDCSHWGVEKLEHAQWISIQYWLRDARKGVNCPIRPTYPMCNAREKVFRKYIPRLQDCEWQRDKSQPLSVYIKGIMKSVSMRRVIH